MATSTIGAKAKIAYVLSPNTWGFGAIWPKESRDYNIGIRASTGAARPVSGQLYPRGVR